MKPIIFLIMISMIFGSCNLFSKKDKEEKEKQFMIYELKRDKAETKKYNYLSELISFKSETNIDTVRIVLKEYYKTYKFYNFNEKTKSLKFNISNFKIGTKEDYDFISFLEKKYKINRKKLFLINYEINLFFKLENLEEISNISSEIEDLNSKFRDD
jgi:hypothetical protein